MHQRIESEEIKQMYPRIDCVLHAVDRGEDDESSDRCPSAGFIDRRIVTACRTKRRIDRRLVSLPVVACHFLLFVHRRNVIIIHRSPVNLRNES